MKAATLTQAYLDGGFTIGNPLNQWSAVDEKRPAVALTVWEDQVFTKEEPWVFDTSAFRRVEIWGDRLGNKIRKKHIEFGLANCAGVFHIIWIVARDPGEEPRRVKQREYMRDRRGILRRRDFNTETGEFEMCLYRLADLN